MKKIEVIDNTALIGVRRKPAIVVVKAIAWPVCELRATWNESHANSNHRAEIVYQAEDCKAATKNAYQQ